MKPLHAAALSLCLLAAACTSVDTTRCRQLLTVPACGGEPPAAVPEQATAAKGQAEDAPSQATQEERPRKQPRVRRRAVPQLPPEPLTQPPPAPAARAVPPSPVPPQVPSRPEPLTTCDPGGCWNAEGRRYDSAGGASGTFLNGSGRLCQQQGAWMQCF